jgi:hypothetical protein
LSFPALLEDGFTEKEHMKAAVSIVLEGLLPE